MEQRAEITFLGLCSFHLRIVAARTCRFPLQIPSLQLYAAVLLGFLWNLSEPRRRRKRISQKADSARGDFGNGWTPLASKDASRISTGFFSKEGHLI